VTDRRLDPRQQEAVEYGDGPLLIVAGPGSGKTRVLVHRVAHMVGKRGIPASSILVTTFTKKAAEEMRERLRGLIGDEADNLWLGTVHSRCLEVLRKGGPEKVGLPRNFTVSGDDESKKIIERISKQVAAEIVARDEGCPVDDVPAISVTASMEQHGLEAMHGRISFAKEWNYGPDQAVAEFNWKRHAREVYLRYNKELRKSGLADFGDLQMLTVEMLQNDPQVRAWMQKRFSYVLVDEYQDTNAVQAQIFRLIAGAHRNITVVGDADQCIPEGQKVSTPSGDKRIESLSVGDEVLAIRGKKAVPAKILKRSESRHDKILEFRTESGRRFRCTPNHVVYASLSRRKDGSYYIYLMWKRGVGWRVGITSSGFLTHHWGQVTRALCEGAERMWFLDRADSIGEARFKEQELSLQYQIPTCTFVARWNEKLPEARRDELFRRFDGGLRLLTDMGMSFDRPIYLAKAQGDGPIAVNVDQAASTGTLVSIFSSRVPKGFLERWNCRVEQREAMHFGRLRALFKSYREALTFARHVQGDLRVPAYISQRLGVGRSPASMRPIDASQLWPGMQVVVQEGGTIRREFVEERKEIRGDFRCYDLEIENLANYFVGGVCVHNSIYAFRGATPQFMLDFVKEWSGAKRIDLGKNYRSTGSIVAASHALIVNNEGRFEYEPSTDNPVGKKPLMVRTPDPEGEADWIVEQVQRLHAANVPYKEMAILYRSHRLSRLPEAAFRAAKLPYEVIGGMPFFERREVKDLLAWLTLIVNPKDRDSFRRAMFAPPRGVGDITLKRLFGELDISGASDPIAFCQVGMLGSIMPKGRKAVREFGQLVDEFKQQASEPGLLSRIVDRSGYLSFLRTQDDGRPRLDNVDELCALFAEFTPPAGMENQRILAFLDWTAAELARTEARKHETDAVPMMTMHASKGSEFDTVFLIGCVNGIVPSSFSDDEDDKVEEERRLFYVAMTRAKNRLYMMAPAQRLMANGDRQPTTPSPFLYEMSEQGATEWKK
jgi:DNA helicase-2/ATP-dependent DNA helicase PcrA